MSAPMDKRVSRLELEAGAKKKSGWPPGSMIPLIAAKDGETSEQTVARWRAEHPEVAVPDEQPGLIRFVILCPLKPTGPTQSLEPKP